jgi:protein disulfide-isomerase A6
LKWFDGKSETPQDYKSGRDLDSLAGFITEKTGLKMRAGGKVPSKVEMLNDKKFNETVGSEKNVLVAFTAPWCGREYTLVSSFYHLANSLTDCKSLAPIWEKVALDFANDPSVVIAKVDAESPDSKKTAQAQGVQSYPTIKWFSAGKTEPVPYEGARTEDAFVEFVNKEAGTFRVPGGGLTATAGTLATVDAVIQKVIDAGSDLVSKAEDIVAAAKAEKGKYAEYYSKVAEKLKKNAGYPEKELKRLEGILKKGSLAPEKLDDLTTRSNILRKFKIVKSEGKSEL